MAKNLKKLKFGLIGYPLKHSLSPYIHEQLMKRQGIEGEYVNYEILPEEFEERIKKVLKFCDGFNVTIPYKEKIIKYIPELSKEAKEFGSVNTFFKNFGYSTDLEGFRRCNIPLKDKNILLLGGGGVARVMLGEAIIRGCKSVGIHTRRKEQADNLINEFNSPMPIFYEEQVMDGSSKKYDVILNATPVGMWPECKMVQIDRKIIGNAEYVFDSIYNPIATKLVLTARSMGVKAQTGLRMLIHQAIASQKIWNPNITFNLDLGASLENELRHKILELFPMKIVLTGFMGSGKTTLGEKLAQTLNLSFIDLDEMIEEENKMKINEIFKEKGEDFFRESESKFLKKVMETPESLILSTGGGALINPKNVDIVQKNSGFIVFLNVDILTILDRIKQDTTRPLLGGKSKTDIKGLYNKRLPIYASIADLAVDGKRDCSLITKEILKAFDLSPSL